MVETSISSGSSPSTPVIVREVGGHAEEGGHLNAVALGGNTQSTWIYETAYHLLDAH